MPTTPNYSWPTPADTDLVKDGAEAIRDLGNAIDTTVDGLPVAGLVHINTTSFSAVASQDVTCFDATYEDYLVQVFLTTSSAAASTLRVQLGLTGSFDTGNNYRSASGHVSVGNAGSTYAQNAVASWQIVNSIDTGKPAKMDLNISKPFLALNTHFTGLYFGRTAASQMAGHVGGIHDLASSYNQIKIFPASGTITGSVSVYGLRF
jgi:hypothetical protein